MNISESVNPVINKIKNMLSKNSFVLGIFLLGSTLDGKNHIDILILIESDDFIDETVKIINDIEDIYHVNPDIWSMEAFKNSGEDTIHKLFKDGKIVYWNAFTDLLASQILRVRPVTIFTFELAGLEQKEKVRYNYQLYGKDNNGLLKLWSGERLGKSCFIVPYANKYKVIRYFEKNNIKHAAKEAYL